MTRIARELVVYKYSGDKRITSREQIVDVINFMRQQYIEHGIGRGTKLS